MESLLAATGIRRRSPPLMKTPPPEMKSLLLVPLIIEETTEQMLSETKERINLALYDKASNGELLEWEVFGVHPRLVEPICKEYNEIAHLTNIKCVTIREHPDRLGFKYTKHEK